MDNSNFNIQKTELLNSAEQGHSNSLLSEGWNWISSHKIETAAIGLAALGIGAAGIAKFAESKASHTITMGGLTLDTKGVSSIISPDWAAACARLKPSVKTITVDAARIAAAKDAENEVYYNLSALTGEWAPVSELPRDLGNGITEDMSLTKINWGKPDSQPWDPAVLERIQHNLANK